MESPKFIRCPECDEKYDDTKKRRLIDSCGHPRCFSCLFVDNPCLVCEKILRGRSKSWMSSKESLLSGDEDQDATNSNNDENRFLTKENYLRALYSYDTGSQENLSKLKNYRVRRSSLDINNLAEKRRNLGRHSNSALVLTTPKTTLNQTSSGESISYARKKHSLPCLSKEIISSRELFMSTQSLSSSSSITKSIEEIIENDRESTESVNDHYTADSCSDSRGNSPRSSGYWSETENYSDQDIKKYTKKCLKELAKIDIVLTGSSYSWEKTKAVFLPSSPSLLKGTLERNHDEKSRMQTRRHSAPEWQFRKFLNNRNKNTHQTNE